MYYPSVTCGATPYRVGGPGGLAGPGAPGDREQRDREIRLRTEEGWTWVTWLEPSVHRSPLPSAWTWAGAP
ncbi:hypothetical protein ACFFX0_30110 [Citricoccus parietis]|uniref:Uncharacterized protein n=1 Tax=Citricoccus parietis TaxID=592307 RepID=A0ABV5G8E4_9MICC